MHRDDIIIKKAIIHILDSSMGIPVLSDNELECGPDLYDFFRVHIEKITSGDDIKTCTFDEDSEVLTLLNTFESDFFVDVSKNLAADLYQIMNANIEIPAADLAIILFRHSEVDYLGLLKMNYKSSYTHYTNSASGENTNDIVRQKALLPSESQRLSEAAIINLETMEIFVLEKKYDIGGVKTNYLSSLFLKCHGPLSSKAKINIVAKAIEQVNNKYFDEDDIKRKMEVKKVLYDGFEASGGLDIENVKEKLFEDKEDMKQEFEEKIEKYQIEEEIIKPQNPQTMKKYVRQFLKTDTGIEISIPMEVYNDSESIEFMTNPDGSISVILKNIGKLTSQF